MTTLLAYCQKAIDIVSNEELLGRYVDVTGLAAQTLTAGNHLAYGGNNEQRYAQYWLWRPSTSTTADKVRNVDSYAPATGVLAHSGTAYSDTTATSEIAILSMFEPQQWRTAVNLAVQACREWDETIVPIVANAEWHWIHELDWIQDAASIRYVKWNRNPVITRNRYLQKRHTVTTGGVLTLDDWTVANNADATPFEATNYRGQKYMYSLERATTNASLTQTVSSLQDGVSGSAPAGELITGVVVCEGVSDVATNVYLDDFASNAQSTTTTAAFQTLTASLTLASLATEIQMAVSAITNDGAQRIYEAYACIGELTDEVRRDNFPAYTLRPDQYMFEQGGPLKIQHPSGMGRGQLLICSERPFPSFDPTRLNTGAADTDESDAPLVPVALGTIANLMEAKFGERHPDATYWRRKFHDACMKHMAYPTGDKGGVTMLNGPIAGMPSRVR